MEGSPLIKTDSGRVTQHLDQVRELPPVQQLEEPPPPVIRKATPKGFDLKSHIYVEPENKTRNELEYDRTGKDQGLVIIFNQIRFISPNHKYRKGTTKDVNDLIFTLGRLGYNFDENYLFSNFGSQEIWDKIKEISQEDLSDRNSLIVFFLSHGDQNDTLVTLDGTINAKDIWGVLGRHKDLDNKPKLFVFQACKGGDLSREFDTKPVKVAEHSISHISLTSYPLPPDILICCCSAEGMKAYRNMEKGSWFIQEICRNFLMYGRRDDVVALFTRVAKCVSTYTHKRTKQMPVLVSTLSKKFYISTNKDRTNKLAIHELHTKISNAVDNLKRVIENLEREGK